MKVGTKYINIKCNKPGRQAVYDKLNKLSEKTGRSMIDLALEILEEGLRKRGV